MIIIDENLSKSLIRRLSNLLPDIRHVHELGLSNTRDADIWGFAERAAAIILTRDRDFALMAGRCEPPPPKVIWLERWDYGTPQIEETLRRHAIRISEFLKNDKTLLSLKRAR